MDFALHGGAVMSHVPGRRWLQFGLRMMFVVTALVGLGFGAGTPSSSRPSVLCERDRRFWRRRISCRYEFGDPRYYRRRLPVLDWVSEAMGDPGFKTTVVIPNATREKFERARAVFPESTYWAYDEAGVMRMLPDVRGFTGEPRASHP